MGVVGFVCVVTFKLPRPHGLHGFFRLKSQLIFLARNRDRKAFAMMNTPATENTVKTVLELDLASYSDISRVLEENLDVYAVKAFQDQIQSFVDQGLRQVQLKRDEVVLGTAGDNALLVFDDAMQMHRFAEAMQRAVADHNSQKTVDSAKRCFRMGAATGPVLLLQEERRIVGTTVARAVRLEAAARHGQILVDNATYDLLSSDVKSLYGEEEEVKGKREEKFSARRCTFVPEERNEKGRPRSPRRLASTGVWITVACVCFVTVIGLTAATLGPLLFPEKEKQSAAAQSDTKKPQTDPNKERASIEKVNAEPNLNKEKGFTPPPKQTPQAVEGLQVLVTASKDEIGNLVVKTLVPQSLGASNVQVASNGKEVIVTLTIRANDQINGARVQMAISTQGLEKVSITKGFGSEEVPVDSILLTQAKTKVESVLKLKK